MAEQTAFMSALEWKWRCLRSEECDITNMKSCLYVVCEKSLFRIDRMSISRKTGSGFML